MLLGVKIKIYGNRTDTTFTIHISDQSSIPIPTEVSEILIKDISDDWTYKGYYTGISLASVIMQFHKGSLEINKSNHKGNTFLLNFPISLFEWK